MDNYDTKEYKVINCYDEIVGIGTLKYIYVFVKTLYIHYIRESYNKDYLDYEDNRDLEIIYDNFKNIKHIEELESVLINKENIEVIISKLNEYLKEFEMKLID